MLFKNVIDCFMYLDFFSHPWKLKRPVKFLQPHTLISSWSPQTLQKLQNISKTLLGRKFGNFLSNFFVFPKFLSHKLLQNTYFLENYPIRALSKWVNEVLSIHLLAKKGDHRPTAISKKVVVVVHRVTLRRSAKKRQLPLNVAYCTSSVVFWYWGW